METMKNGNYNQNNDEHDNELAIHFWINSLSTQNTMIYHDR